jgi:hypothetical protein
VRLSSARRAARFLAIAAVVALAGCGAEDDGDVIAGDADTPVTSPPTDAPDATGAPPAAGARLVEPTPGLDNVVPTAIDSAVIVDETMIEVRFYNGVEPCYGVDHATVEPSATAVLVEVGVGSNPAAGGVACIEIAELQAVRLTLAEPLGERAIVDESTGQPVPATSAG